MFRKDSNHTPTVPVDRLRFFTGFPQRSLDDTATYYVAQFERMAGMDQPDQYYVAILDINEPVVSSDPRTVFAVALVWDYAPTMPALSKKIAAWLGEAL